MPVDRSPRPDLRTILMVGLAGVVVALGLVLGVLLLSRGGGNVEVRIGEQDFRDMEVGRISEEIDDRGPILFGDVADGELDIILQHIGDDPESGWYAFEARRPGESRDCFFRWREVETEGEDEVDGESEDADSGEAEVQGDFVNTCDPEDVVDAYGSGLRQFDVTVVDGDVRVDLKPE